MDSDKISQHFGRCQYFLIINLDDNKEIKDTKVVKNKPCDGKGHGKSVKILLDEKIDGAICINIGKNSIENLSKKGVKIYRCHCDDVDKCIELFINGQLDEILTKENKISNGDNND